MKQYVNTNVAINNEGQKGYQIDIDSLNRRSVVLKFYKGMCGDIEKLETESMIMIRLFVQLIGDLRKYIPVDGLVSKEIIESVDIEFYLIEHFLFKKYERKTVISILSNIREMYKVKKVGEFLGQIKIGYDVFTGFVVFLNYLSYETFKKEDVL